MSAAPYLTDENIPARLPEFADQVLEIVEQIPAGTVMSYGDVAAYLGKGGPRQVGRVMTLFSGGVPWWRVVRADGSPPAGHEQQALAHYHQEGTPLHAVGTRVDMKQATWVPTSS